ncbi:MAG TPA: hypothetical protein VL221_02250 [Bacteroidota bacterium]|nr:hypothetical protein [Bacteroidota bacterium]
MAKEYDPRMHSAEHILNQTMIRMFGTGRAFSAHVEKRKSRCDYRFGRDLTAEEARELERRVNAVVAADLPVRAEFLAREDAARTFDLGRLPADAPGTVRIVRIGDYDACPCSGAHVERSAAIGTFRVASTQFADGVLRIRFRLQD